jgi:hypothetical protein
MFGNKDDDTVVEKGPGLARGPALILGSILVAAGLLAIVKHSTFPSFGSNFPDGTATGSKWLGLFGVNGWTCWLVIACGGLLLFGSAQHLLAKTMSLAVGLILGAASVIALVDGQDTFGLAYQNGLTKLALGIAAAILLFNTLAPRVKHEKPAQGEPRGTPVDTTGRTERVERPVGDRAGSTETARR